MDGYLYTYATSWVIKFIDLKGVYVLCNGLTYLNHKTERYDLFTTTHLLHSLIFTCFRNEKTLELEIEIVKCIKVLINTRVSIWRMGWNGYRRMTPNHLY